MSNETDMAGALGVKLPHEPLLTSAPLAKNAAETLCHRSTKSGPDEDCAWYHGYWQYLRILGIVATPERHADFYARALGGLAASGQYRRILISANADYAMLAHLLLAYGEAAKNLSITAMDICETPLMLCKWYAERHGIEIETEACDILEWQTEKRFDLIVTHSFLPMLPAAARQALMTKWRQVLRPGGKVVTTTRINPDWTEAQIKPDDERVTAFRESARREALKWHDVNDIDTDQLAEAAGNYIRRRKHYSLRSESELRTLFNEADFAFDRFDLVAVKGKFSPSQSGPGTSQSATYAEFVATRA
ncbi:MAG: class I SAM-dependent methyltransferase [Rhodospirillaceae bacterium]|nr:class I SAM-dependent methyltransferase [Rhodospirillaceae bacterium]